MDKIDITIVGAGASGLAAAYRLGERHPDKTIFVLEKNLYVAGEQSGHNSGVDHSRYQYHPNSLKSKLRGHSPISLKQFCLENDVDYKTTGKLIVATDVNQVKELKFYLDRANQAGIPIKYLSKKEVEEREPNVECLAALYTPTTGIVDAAGYVGRLANFVKSNENSEILLETKVVNLETDGKGFIVSVNQAGEEYQFMADMVINAAGVFGDELARMVNPSFPHTIKPLRGEYMKFNRISRPELWTDTNVYPVPTIIKGMFDEHGNPKRAAGTHTTLTFGLNGDIGNEVWLGPLHGVIKDKNDYYTNRRQPDEFIEQTTFFPVRKSDLSEEQTGIQLKFSGFDDWVIERDKTHPNLVHYLEDSPGMSGSLDSSHYLVHEVLKEGIL